jgi:hypothetical protein
MYQVFWASSRKRWPGMRIVEVISKLLLNRQTRRRFEIPENVIFWGCPPSTFVISKSYFTLGDTWALPWTLAIDDQYDTKVDSD